RELKEDREGAQRELSIFRVMIRIDGRERRRCFVDDRYAHQLGRTAIRRRIVVVRDLAHARVRERELVIVVLLRDQLLRPSPRVALHRMPLLVERDPLLVDPRGANLRAKALALVPSSSLLARLLKRGDRNAQRHALAARPALRAKVRRTEAAPTALEE